IRMISQFTFENRTYHATLLRNLGEAAKNSDPSVQIWAHLGLMTVKMQGKKDIVGMEHVPPIAKLLSHEDPAVRILAAQSTGLIGPAARSASSALIARFTEDKDVGVIATCMSALVRVEEADAVPPIVKVLKEHKEPTVRVEAAKALSHVIKGK